MKAYYEKRTYANPIPLSVNIGNGFDFLAHWHNDIEFVYVLDGDLKMGVNTECRVLQKGDFALCSSGDIHYYDSKDLYSNYYMMLFKPELLESKSIWPVNLRFSSPFIPSGFLEKKGIGDSIHRILDSLYTESKRSREYSPYFQQALLYELCGLLLSEIPSEPLVNVKLSTSVSHLKIMQQALQYIESNYTSNIGLENTARTINMSPFYFSRLFNQVTGRNFRSYLNSIRIEKAEEKILSELSKSIIDIAYESGFQSIRTFNRAFKSIKGHAPSSLRCSRL